MFYMNLAILDGICIYPTETGQRAFCPECGGAVMSKVGAIKEAHWAHLAETNCEGYYKPMSDWHRSWQEKFPKEWREVYTKKDGEVCIADVKTPRGTTIEFQHSPISQWNIDKRKRVHEDIFWVLDAKEYYTSITTCTYNTGISVAFKVTEDTVSGKDAHMIVDILSSMGIKNDYFNGIQIEKISREAVRIYGKFKYRHTYLYTVIIKGIHTSDLALYDRAYAFMANLLTTKRSLRGIFDAKLDLNSGGSLNAILGIIKYTEHSLYITKKGKCFSNSNGVFIDNAENVPEDSLLQVFKDGTFKIFKKEGFIQKLLSHSQTKTN